MFNLILLVLPQTVGALSLKVLTAYRGKGVYNSRWESNRWDHWVFEIKPPFVCGGYFIFKVFRALN